MGYIKEIRRLPSPSGQGSSLSLTHTHIFLGSQIFLYRWYRFWGILIFLFVFLLFIPSQYPSLSKFDCFLHVLHPIFLLVIVQQLSLILYLCLECAQRVKKGCGELKGSMSYRQRKKKREVWWEGIVALKEGLGSSSLKFEPNIRKHIWFWNVWNVWGA